MPMKLIALALFSFQRTCTSPSLHFQIMAPIVPEAVVLSGCWFGRDQALSDRRRAKPD
jgi:hypothetical protein